MGIELPRTYLERLDTRAKLTGLAVWVVCVVSLPGAQPFPLAGYAVLLLSLLLLAGRGAAVIFARRFAAALPFVVLLIALLPFASHGKSLWQYGGLSITDTGVRAALHAGSRAVLCVGAVCLVWATTREPELLGGLRGLGAPAVLIGVLAFMLRYLHVLRPELHRLAQARAARTIGRRPIAPLRTAGNLLGAFFVRTQDRALRVADAMAARGYSGQPVQPAAQRSLPAADAVATALFATLLVAWRCIACR